MDQITEVTEEGLVERLIRSFAGVLLGIGLFLGSFALLYWNEGRLQAQKGALAEMA